MSAPIQPIDPVQRSTLGTIVTDQLRDHVIHGRFEPGAILGEVELAGRFGVSRGPVREALQRLVQEGLLRREPRRGISVPVLTDVDIADLYLAREAIEAAAMQVVLRGDPRTMAVELQATVDRMRVAVAADDWGQVADLDIAFHRRMVDAAGSPRLSRLYASVIGETRACFNMTAWYPGREHLVDEHQELAVLVAARDVKGAQAALASHLSRSVETLARHRPRETPEAVADGTRTARRTTRRRSPSIRSTR